MSCCKFGGSCEDNLLNVSGEPTMRIRSVIGPSREDEEERSCVIIIMPSGKPIGGSGGMLSFEGVGAAGAGGA